MNLQSQIWSCPHCTFDNYESTQFCEMCGCQRLQAANIQADGTDLQPGRNMHGPRDLGRRVAGSSEDVAVDQMEFGEAGEIDWHQWQQ